MQRAESLIRGGENELLQKCRLIDDDGQDCFFNCIPRATVWPPAGVLSLSELLK